MDNPGPSGTPATPLAERGNDGGGMWPHIYKRLLELIQAHRSTIVFVNSRRLAERVAQQVSELAAAIARPTNVGRAALPEGVRRLIDPK